jgi:uncharacterized protein
VVPFGQRVPIEEELSVLGLPEVRLRVRADEPVAIVAVRICDVAPDGTSLLVTRGVLDLTHRHGHDRSTAMPIDEPVDVTIRIDALGHRFAVGHRLRVAISSSYWPWIWPTPSPTCIEVIGGEITLPLLADDTHEIDMGEPRSGDEARIDVVSRDADEPDYLLGRVRYVDLDIEATESGHNEQDPPPDARVRVVRGCELRRDDWQVRVEADATMTCPDGVTFEVTSQLRAWEGDRLVADRSHVVRVRRP